MIFRGFKFGMLLQFAIGPVCIFIFQMASLHGFAVAETGVAGVALVDGLYIFVAILGIASILDRRNIRVGIKILGAIILFVFGLSTMLSQWNISLLPSWDIPNLSTSTNTFTRAVLLTASNPLTVIFWAGVFSSKAAEENLGRKEIYQFGLGALLSTLFFLSLIALAGSVTKTFFPPDGIRILNIFVGVLLIYFSGRMVLRKV